MLVYITIIVHNILRVDTSVQTKKISNGFWKTSNVQVLDMNHLNFLTNKFPNNFQELY